MAHEQKTQNKNFWLDYGYADEKKSWTPQNDVHTSEDIHIMTYYYLQKLSKKIPLSDP